MMASLLIAGTAVLLLQAQQSDMILTGEPYSGEYAISGDRFAVWNGTAYMPLFVKGINLGVAVPGTQPGQLAATGEDYARWFQIIKEAGYNTVRIYTLHYPRFYEELRRFNLEHPRSPLLLLQGIWLEEQAEAADLFLLTEQFDQEITEVVRAVHGDILIDERPGKADGDFSSDVSGWVLGYLAGREIFPDEVTLTNEAHPGVTGYQGAYLELSGGGDPVEVWITERLDSLKSYEISRYGSGRPAGFSSWPTLDPISHPTEQLLPDSQEDDEKIDLSNVVASQASGGFFIGYHAYPYYPDFIVQDPLYRAETDPWGPNSYLGYIRDLKKHYGNIPLVIAEFGVPTSWGSGHLTSTGMNHGGITEEQQAEFSIRMLDNIHEAGCAGGIQFALIDEWFKQTWITNPFSRAEYRHFWHNITAPEQNFGILSYVPPPEPFQVAGNFPGASISRIRTSSDYTFFRIRVYMDTESHREDTIWMALDTYARDLGESVLPGGRSIGTGGDTLRAEFALSIPVGGERADLYVIPSYDIYGIRDPVRIDTLVSTRSDEGKWNRVRWKTNYFYDYTQYIGKLNITDSDDPFQFLNAVTVFNDSLEIRIPWTLLNYSAPSVRRAIHYISYTSGGEIRIIQQDTLSDGIAVTAVLASGIYPAVPHSWSFWDYEKIRNDPPIERKKGSFYSLKSALPQYNSQPIGFKDAYTVFPGESLEVETDQGLLANDYDIDGNELKALLAFGNSPENGTLELHPNGSFRYEPHSGFRGEERFSYYLDDGYTYSALVSVSIHVGYPLGDEWRKTGSEGDMFRIYPNPGKEDFYISASRSFTGASLVVYDMTGRQVAFRSLDGELTHMDLSGMEPGIYIFSISYDDRSEVHRIIRR